MGARGVGLSLTLRLAASSSNLPTRGADVQPPAAVYVKEPPAFSVYTRRSGRAGREGNWAPGPRRGGQAAAPRTQAAPSPKHTRTHARARRPIGSHGAVGRRSHRSPFIPPKARFPGPGHLQPAVPGGSRGASKGVRCATTRPPSSHSHRILSTRIRSPADSRSITIATVAPCSPLPRHPAAPLRPAALGSPLPGRPGTPRGRGKRRQLPSLAAPGTAAPRRERAEGGWRRPRGSREQKFRPPGAQPRPRLLPGPPPRSSPPEPCLSGVCASGTPTPTPPHPPPTSSVRGGRDTGAGGPEVAPGGSRGESDACPPTCLGPLLETSSKCAGKQSARLGDPCTTTAPSTLRALAQPKRRSVCPSVLRLQLPERGGAGG